MNARTAPVSQAASRLALRSRTNAASSDSTLSSAAAARASSLAARAASRRFRAAASRSPCERAHAACDRTVASSSLSARSRSPMDRTWSHATFSSYLAALSCARNLATSPSSWRRARIEHDGVRMNWRLCERVPSSHLRSICVLHTSATFWRDWASSTPSAE